MITVRNAVFETNSSSTHAISFVTNYDLDKLPHYLSFHLDRFGWESKYVNALDYLYTAIVVYYDHDMAEEKLDHLKALMDEYKIEYKFYPEFDKINPRDGETIIMIMTTLMIRTIMDLKPFINGKRIKPFLIRILIQQEHIFTKEINNDFNQKKCF